MSLDTDKHFADKGLGADDLEKAFADISKRVIDQAKAERRKKFWTVMFGVPFAIALLPFTMWWHGYVISTIWGWFVEPVFHIHLAIYYAVGLTIAVRLLVLPSNYATNQKPKGIIASTSVEWIVPLVALGVGAFWHWLGWGL